MKIILPLSFLTGVLSLITSCALPPREAMRIVQRDGLISYLSHDYSHYAHTTPASAAPLRVSPVPYTTPRPVTSVPYRSTYHTNRYAKADYNEVPDRPKSSAGQNKSRTAAPKRKVVSNRQVPTPRRSTSPATSVNDKPMTSSSKTSPSVPPVAAAKKPAEALPYGSPVAGRPGMVTSPFAQKQQLVDVTGMAPGDTVKDPYSGKLFRVPPTQQASAASLPSTAASPETTAATEKPSPVATTPAPVPSTEVKPSSPETPKP